MTKIVKLAWNEFIYGGHLLSLGAVSIVFTSALLLEIKITWDCLLVVYLGMHSAYLYNRYKEFHKDYETNPERTNHFKKNINKLPIVIVFLSTLLALILILNNNPKVLFLGLILFSISLLYSKGKGFKSLTQRVPGFKNLFVALMWGTLPLFLVFYYSFPITPSLFLLIIFVFLRFFINTSSFDIKDIESDKKDGLLTLAIVLSRNGLVRFLNILNLFSSIPIIIGVYFGYFPSHSLLLVIFVNVYTFYFLKIINKKEKEQISLYNVIIDAELLLWSGFIVLGKIFI